VCAETGSFKRYFLFAFARSSLFAVDGSKADIDKAQLTLSGHIKSSHTLLTWVM